MLLVVYALAFISNVIFVYCLPIATVASFLKVYSISAMLIGIVIVYAFSHPVLIDLLSRLRFVLLTLLLLISVAGTLAENIQLMAFSYAVTLLLSDYLLSQSSSQRLVLNYRCMLICTVIPAWIGISGYDEMMVSIRIFGCLALAFLSAKKSPKLQLLFVQNPFFYIAGTHFFYFGSLSLITWSGANELVKNWYIFTQIGQGILLKLYDYKIRAHGDAYRLYKPFIYSVVLTLAFIFNYWFPNQLAFCVYLMGVLGLVITSKFSRVW